MDLQNLQDLQYIKRIKCDVFDNNYKEYKYGYGTYASILCNYFLLANEKVNIEYFDNTLDYINVPDIMYLMETNTEYRVNHYHRIYVREIIIPNDQNILDIYTFEIYSGDNYIFKIPFNFLLYKSKVIKKEKYTTVIVSQEIFADDNIHEQHNEKYLYMPLRYIMFHEHWFLLRSKNNFKYTIKYDYGHEMCSNLPAKIYRTLYYDVYEYNTCTFKDKKKITINNACCYTGFFLQIVHNQSSQLNALDILIDNMLNTSYNYNRIKLLKTINYYTNSYTRHHQIVLYDTLRHFLPDELIAIIENYVAPSKISEYYIPFRYNQNTKDRQLLKFIFNKKFCGNLTIIRKSYLIISGGMCRLKHKHNQRQ